MKKLKDRLPYDIAELGSVFHLPCSPALLAGRIEAVERIRQVYAAVLESDLGVPEGMSVLSLLEMYAQLFTAGKYELAPYCARLGARQGPILWSTDYRQADEAHETAATVYAAAERRKRAQLDNVLGTIALANADLNGPGS